jgi:wobble nucleotide-excising tRNase
MEGDHIDSLVTKLQNWIEEANAATVSHNQTVTNIATEKQALTSQVWRYVIHELADDLLEHEQKKKSLNKTIKGMEEGLQARGIKNWGDAKIDFDRREISMIWRVILFIDFVCE